MSLGRYASKWARFYEVANDAERCVEDDAINHFCARLMGVEEVFVVERGEWPLDLLVNETARASSSVILLVIVHVIPKCLARHVTVSPSPIDPWVTPPIASSPDDSIDAR